MTYQPSENPVSPLEINPLGQETYGQLRIRTSPLHTTLNELAKLPGPQGGNRSISLTHPSEIFTNCIVYLNTNTVSTEH